MNTDEQTIMDDARDQLLTYHHGRRNMSAGYRFGILPRHDEARRRWWHRCHHTGPMWRATRRIISFPARDEWIRQSDLPGQWNP